MKCDTVRDLLPLYIDGLTSDTSNMGIQKHLKYCQECTQYYKEMKGELSDILPKVEISEAQLLKKTKNKRKIVRGAVIGIISLFSILVVISAYFLWPSKVKYENVELNYGREGNTVHMELISKGYYDIVFNGTTEAIKDETGKEVGTRSSLKVVSKSRSTTKEGGLCEWKVELEDEDQIYEWVFGFEDKIITIRNGVLVSEVEP